MLLILSRNCLWKSQLLCRNCLWACYLILCHQVTNWSSWGKCIAPKGRCSVNSGTETRSRNVTSHPSCGGKPCPSLSQSKRCTPVPIPCKVGVDLLMYPCFFVCVISPFLSSFCSVLFCFVLFCFTRILFRLGFNIYHIGLLVLLYHLSDIRLIFCYHKFCFWSKLLIATYCTLRWTHGVHGALAPHWMANVGQVLSTRHVVWRLSLTAAWRVRQAGKHVRASTVVVLLIAWCRRGLHGVLVQQHAAQVGGTRSYHRTWNTWNEINDLIWGWSKENAK